MAKSVEAPALDFPQTQAQKDLAGDLAKLLELYRARRKPHDARVQETCEYLLPDREILMRGIDQRGMSTGENVFDDVGTHCVHVWSDGMLGYTASPSAPWALWRMMDRELNKLREAKAYCQDFGEQMYSEFKNGGLYRALAMFLRDLAVPGTASCYVADRPGKPFPLYRVLHPVSVFIGVDADGEIDIELVEYYISARNIVNYFGEEAAGGYRVKQAKSDPLKDIRVLWALVPRTERIEGLLGIQGKPIAGYYVDLERCRLLKEEGFEEMPVITARCILDSGDEYGRSPGSNALRSVKRASIMSMANMLGAQRAVDKPFLAPIELRGKIRRDPGGMGWYERGEYTDGAIWEPYQGMELPVTAEMQYKLEEAVKRHYFYDIFMRLLLEGKQMTAFEVQKIISERAIVLAPIIFQYLQEGLDRMVTRSSAIAGRAGRLPKPPQVIVDWVADNPARRKRAIEVEYIGPLIQAQQTGFRMFGIMGFMDAVRGVPSQAAVLDRPNWDEIVEDIAEGHALPQKDIRTDEEVAAIREQSARVQQAMRQAEFAKIGAEIASKTAQRPEGGSPLEGIMAGQGVA